MDEIAISNDPTIVQLINDYGFPWYYIDDVTAAFEDGNQGRPGLSHVYVEHFYCLI